MRHPGHQAALLSHRHALRMPMHCFQVTSDGKPVALYSDTSGRHISSISAVTESNGVLVFGSLMNSYISMLSLGDLEATVSPETQRQSL